MDALRFFHRARLRELLLRTQPSPSPPPRQSTTPPSQLSSGSPAERLYHIPELVLLLLDFVPPTSWPALCLVSKDLARITQAQIWTRLSCSTTATADKIRPHLLKHAQQVQTLDLALLCQPSLSSLLIEFSLPEYPRLTSLNLQGAEPTVALLAHILQRLPALRSVNVLHCRLDEHPLDILRQCTRLHSISFSQDSTSLALTKEHSSVFDAWPDLNLLRIEASIVDEVAAPMRLLQEAIEGSNLNLEALELEMAWGWPESTLSKLFHNSHRLSSLHLTRCDISGPCLLRHSSSLSLLSSLRLHECPRISIDDCLSLLQLCPQVRYLDLAMVTISLGAFEQLSQTLPLLALLRLESCIFSPEGLRSVLAHCRKLKHLVVDVLPGPRAIATLFGGPPWGCQGLQELVIHGIQWTPAELRHEQSKSQALALMWTGLAGLAELRVLTLKRLKGKLSTPDHEGGLRQLGAVYRLERLCLTGHDSWQYRDALWIAENLPWLEQLEYAAKEMSTPLWAWLRNNRPDVKLVESHSA